MDSAEQTARAPGGEWPDERAQMGSTGGAMWLLAGLTVLAGLALPGVDRAHEVWVIAIAAGGIAYGLLALSGVVPWRRMSMRSHLIAVTVTMPVAAVLVWATGGLESYALALLALPLFFCAYFYPPRTAFALVTLLLAAIATPALYDPHVRHMGYPSRFLSTVAACYALTAVIVVLKRRLVDAERLQRTMALRDPLTGLANRRAFDAALQDEVVRAQAAAGGRRAADDRAGALLFADIDHFKQLNDVHGHPAGDRALRSLAARFAAVVRPGDTLARIGGDEFAVVAPSAGPDGAERLAASLVRAASDVLTGPALGPLRVTVSVALIGPDGRDAEELMRSADHRLHDAKRARVATA